MSNNRLIRTFVAIELPGTVGNSALSLHSTVEAHPKVVKWVKLRNIHLTLKFTGETPEALIPNINSALAKAVKSHYDFSLTIEGTGVFPKKERPRILWMGAESGGDQLSALVGDINRVLDPLGFPAEEREFSSHITIGRIRYPQKVTPDVSTFLNSSYDPIQFTVEKINFFQSDLVPGGPIYSNLGVHQLTPNQ